MKIFKVFSSAFIASLLSISSGISSTYADAPMQDPVATTQPPAQQASFTIGFVGATDDEEGDGGLWDGFQTCVRSAACHIGSAVGVLESAFEEGKEEGKKKK